MNLEQPCPLVDRCNAKTGVCLVLLPDETCYYYRWFKEIIKQREAEANTSKEGREE